VRGTTGPGGDSNVWGSWPQKRTESNSCSTHDHGQESRREGPPARPRFSFATAAAAAVVHGKWFKLRRREEGGKRWEEEDSWPRKRKVIR